MMRWRDQSGPTRLASLGPVATSGATPEPFRTPRARVAVLVDSLRNSYQTTVVAGLADAAIRRDVDLAVFAGGVLGAPGGAGVNRNFVFQFCDRSSFDGAVVLGG